MADRIPLIVDTDDGNKLKELPIGDNLNLTGSGIVGAGNISATSLTVAGVPYNPFSGAYGDLTGAPTIPTDTDDIVEGSKLYFSAERVDDRVKDLLVAGSGIQLVYNDTANTLTITSTGGGGGGGGSSTLAGLTDVTITAPITNQFLKYNGTEFVNAGIDYANVGGTPNLATVATTGSYNDLSNKPIIPNDLDDLSDVDTTTIPPTNGQVLKWLNNKWAPADDITSGGGGLNADTLDGFDSTHFLNFNNITNKPTYEVNDLGDISITNLSGNQILKYTGLTWVNSTNEPDFSDVQNKPTTLSGYGITDSPTVLTDLGITDGSANQLLKTNGAGNFTFTSALSGVSIVNGSSINLAASSGITITSILDENNLSSDSDTALATQQSIKAYVDTAVAGNTEGLSTRSNSTQITASIADNANQNLTFSGFKTYALLYITTSAAAWVRVYTSSTARANDATRVEGVDPSPDAGVVAEVLTTGSQTITFGPSILGSNSANDSTIYVAVKNKSGSTASISTTLGLLKLEA
jgi:hypothetical protein